MKKKLNKITASLKYISAFVLIALVFYFIFLPAGSYNPVNWPQLNHDHFAFYGLMCNAIVVIFIYVDNNFKHNKK